MKEVFPPDVFPSVLESENIDRFQEYLQGIIVRFGIACTYH